VQGERRAVATAFLPFTVQVKHMLPLLLQLLLADDGQDVLEYALLTAAIGVAGIATWPLIEAAIAVTYQQFDTDTQDLWEVPDPGAGA
jgi:Flp pilus assembly pilin Flp